MIVPDGVGAVEEYGDVFESDVLQFGFVLEEEPVGDPYIEFAGIEECVFVQVPHEGPFHVKPVEKGGAYLLDTDFCFEYFREFGGGFVNQPILYVLRPYQ